MAHKGRHQQPQSEGMSKNSLRVAPAKVTEPLGCEKART